MGLSEVATVGPGVRDSALLSLMPVEVRRMVEASLIREAYEFGDVIVAEGDPGGSLYLLAAGTARVIKRGANGEEVPLNILRPGDAFGERALLEPEGVRTATVRASSPVQVLRLDWPVFDALVRSNPRIRDYLELHLRRYALSDFMRVHSAFAALSPEAMVTLLEGLQPVAFTAGTTVIHQGQPPGPMYIVRRGRLRALGGPSGRDPVGFFRTGDSFGERGLITGEDSAATIEAVADCELLSLKPETLNRLVDGDPGFRRQLEQRIRQHEFESAARVPLDFAEEVDVLEPAISPLGTVRAKEVAGPPSPPEKLPETPFSEKFAGTPVPRTPGVGRRRIRRFPHVYQVDEMDCGAAALAMVCRYFGRKVPLARVRTAVNTAIDGTSLLGIARGAEALGLRASSFKVSHTRVDALPLPAIIHWQGNHWVVLYALDELHARVSDPARGRRRLRREELLQKWSGYSVFLEPTEAFAQAPEGGSPTGWMFDFFRPYRAMLVGALALALVAAALEMTIPVLAKFIVDRVILGGHHNLLTLLVLGMFGAIALTTMATVIQRAMLASVAVNFDRTSLDFLSRRLLALPMSYFNTRRTGDIQRRLEGLRQVRQLVVQQGVIGIAAAMQVLVAVVVMLVFSLPLALLYLAAMPVYIGLMRLSARKLRPTYDSLEEAWGKYQSHQIDSIKGIETVKAMGAEDALSGLLVRQFETLAPRLFRTDLSAMLYESAIQLVSFLSLALFLWIGALEVIHHHLSIGEMLSFNALVVLANAPIVTVLILWDQLQYSHILLERLNDITDQEPEQGTDRSALRSVPTLSGAVRFRNMTFAYPGAASRPVLDSIELDVPAGTNVAIVGRSGSGKTTLIKCLAGLLEPTGGTILFDGIELRDLDYGQLRRHIGFVLQENHMFAGTIEQNIAFASVTDDIDHDRVAWAARVANAEEFIERFPLGYETRIGETGLLLSGGQSQRIAIARAVYNEPVILVFDEATSALDVESERAVRENMDQLLAGHTSFVIAHRLSTVRNADVIVVLEQGRIVEAGDHDELMAREGLYAYLCSQQIGG